MKTLIIEDDPQKAERVKEMLSQLEPPHEISTCRSYQTALREVLETDNQFDLVILDMSLPTFDPNPGQRQGRPRPLGGVDIMRKLRRHDKGVRVIVLTALENFGSRGEQFNLDQLRSLCRAEFPDMFVDAVYYSQSRMDWHARLQELIGAE